MWRDRDRYRDHQYVPDTFWLVVAVLLFAACGLVWLIGQVAAILFGAHEHLPVRLVDMLGVLLQLPGTWDDPAQAWPPSAQPLLPGPVGMYAAAVLTFWIPALLYGLLVRLVSPRARRRRRERGARWAQVALRTSGLMEVVTRLPCHSRMAGMTRPWVLNDPGGPKARTEWHCSTAR